MDKVDKKASSSFAAKREVWIDWMRVAACFMVMVVHAMEPFYIGGQGALVRTEADAWWAAFFNSVVRMCVPLFIIASSYLQFPLRYTAGEFFRRRVVRVLVPFAVWSLLYALLNGDPAANLYGLLFNFDYCAGHLWFVYMLIGIYLLMPMLSPWAARVGKRELQAYLAVCFFTTLFPLLRDWISSESPTVILGSTGIPRQALYPLWGECSWNSYGLFYYFSGFIGYLLLGLYFRRFAPVHSWGRTLAVALPCWLAGFAVVMVGFLRRVLSMADGCFPVGGGLDTMIVWETTWCNDTIGVALMTVGTVMMFRRVTASGRFYVRWLMPVSQASYGMYLSHMFVLSAVSGFLCSRLGMGVDGVLGEVWTTPVQIVGSACLSFAIVAVCCVGLRRIPGLGKYLVG